MSKQFRRAFGELILRRKRKQNEMSGVAKFKANRKKQKKKDSFNNKKKDKKIKMKNNKPNGQKPAEDKSASSVFVTSKM